jgi:hypothetical protein
VGHKFFGCRGCLDLSYESSQVSHSGVRRLRKNPKRCLAILDSPPETLGQVQRFNMAWKAAPGSRFKGAGKVPWREAMAEDGPGRS